jgi:hypothetical protein
MVCDWVYDLFSRFFWCALRTNFYRIRVFQKVIKCLNLATAPTFWVDYGRRGSKQKEGSEEREKVQVMPYCAF